MDEDGATHTEYTEEQDERLERLAVQLSSIEGADSKGVEFAIQMEQLIPDYRAAYGEWIAGDVDGRRGTSLRIYAMERLGELEGDAFEEEYELKRDVYALGRLAGRNPTQSRALSKSLWQSSTKYSTPQQGEARVASPTL